MNNAAESPDYAERARAVKAWREYAAKNNAPVPPGPQSNILVLPPPTTEDKILPPHREWEQLYTLNPHAISELVRSLQTRCAAARQTLETVLATLEMATYIMLEKHTPASSAEFTHYIDALRKAQGACHALFPPQKAYQNAVVTLGFLVADLVHFVPGGGDRARVGRALEKGMVKMYGEEEAGRKALRDLAKIGGNASEKLLAYMFTANMRLKTWCEGEEKLRVLAEECCV